MGKLSTEEIEIAGRAAHDAYYEEGYQAGRNLADILEKQMILSGSTSSDHIYAFEKATGYSYRGKR